jgi:hypothetical protein
MAAKCCLTVGFEASLPSCSTYAATAACADDCRQRVEAGADERRRRYDFVGQDDRLLRHLSKGPFP